MVKINFDTIEERLAAQRSAKKIDRIVIKPMEINVAETLKQAENKAPAPLPVVELDETVLTTSVKKELSEDDMRWVDSYEMPRDIIARVKAENGDTLEHQLWIEFNALKVERNKLSTEISRLVENEASKERLAEQYAKIESYRPDLIALYDKIQYVKQHGCLPAVQETTTDLPDAYRLKDEKKKLVDKRCKLKRKLKESAKASKPEKILEWEQELAQADLQYIEVENQLKQLEGKA